MWKQIVAIAVLGAAGSVARYLVYLSFARWGTERLAWATVAVNMIGCVLFGLIWSALEDRSGIAPQMRVALLAGLMGALTTYSTFAFDTYRMLENQQWLLAIGYVAGQLVFGLIAMSVGIAIGKWF